MTDDGSSDAGPAALRMRASLTESRSSDRCSPLREREPRWMVSGALRLSGGALLFSLCLLSGCAHDTHRAETRPRGGGPEWHCGPPPDHRPAIPVPARSRIGFTPNAPALRGFSPTALEIAQLIGAYDLLKQLHEAGGEPAQGDMAAMLRQLQVRERLSTHILLASLDVNSAAAEADCESERAQALADRLEKGRQQWVTRLTVLSLVVAGLGAIVSGALSLEAHGVAADAVTIGSGAAEIALGSAALFGEARHEFRHERNLLREVWEGPKQPKLLPLLVWRFLTHPSSHDRAHRSLRESLIARWRDYGRLGEPGSKDERRRIALFFGNGGTYTMDELRAREAMLGLLEADINLMSHDLEELLKEVLAQTRW